VREMPYPRAMDPARRQERSRILGAALPAELAASDPDSARLHAMLEVAFLAAAADGELADAEIEHLVANLQAWLGAELAPKLLIDLFDHLGSQLAAEGSAARLAAAAELLDADARRVAYKLACVTVLCDLEVHDDELGFLGTIATAFGMTSEEAQAIFDELDDAVSALAAG
jgi:hypothetical protein